MVYNIYSIGHSNKTTEQFIKELKDNKIELLVDLRTQPYSRYVPNFNTENLKANLEDEGMNYLFFGDKLGGRPPEGIDAFLASNRFKENVTELLSKIKDRRAALMCSEADQEQCHRRFIVREIVARGINVTILGKQNKQEQAMNNKKEPKQATFGDF